MHLTPRGTVQDVRVSGLFIHPVKSMQGQPVESASVTANGIDGDRQWGVLDQATGRILSAKWEPRLLEASALLAGAELVIKLPTGETLLGAGDAVDAALSGWLGRPVHLLEARARSVGTYALHVDPLDDTSKEASWDGPPGRFVDEAAVHVLSAASLRAAAAAAGDSGQWERRRFRPNVLVEADGEGFVDDGWVGATLRIGAVELAVDKRTTRCAMVSRAQAGGLASDPEVIRSLRRSHQLKLGVSATVCTPGPVNLGDPVEVLGGDRPE